MANSITELANKSGTDKGTQFGAAHGYSVVYDALFSSLRTKPNLRLLELGLAIGGPELGGGKDREIVKAPSIEIWLNYFCDAYTTGFDISDFSNLQNDRFRFLRGDAGNREDLERVIETGDSFDIIIDDASHASFHQQLALDVLFHAVSPGGFFIIEDLSWQPVAVQKSLPNVPRTSKLLAELLSTGCLPMSRAFSSGGAASIETQVSAILLFDESYLNALGNRYNYQRNLPPVNRGGWRGMPIAKRFLSPHFWLFSGRRLIDGAFGAGAVDWKSVKLAILQKSPA